MALVFGVRIERLYPAPYVPASQRMGFALYTRTGSGSWWLRKVWK